MLAIEIANFVGLFVETLLFGILLVTVGNCLTSLLFQTQKCSFKKSREIKWWAVCVTVSMFVVPTLDLVLNFRLNVEAFGLIVRQESPMDIEQDVQTWVGITRYTLYITQVVIADSVLVFRLFVIYGRKCDTKIILLSLFVPITMSGAIFVVVFGVTKHDLLGADSRLSEIALWGIDALFNVLITSLIVHKIWAAHSNASQFSINSNEPWLMLIRIVVESGLLYVVSEVALLVSALFGSPSICVADAVGPITAVATILIISRTHDMAQKMPRTNSAASVFSTNLSSIAATSATAPVLKFMGNDNDVGLAS